MNPNLLLVPTTYPKAPKVYESRLSNQRLEETTVRLSLNSTGIK